MDAGVEKIIDLQCRHALGLPNRHPVVFHGAIRCPSVTPLSLCKVPVVVGGAWWLENWIVDASKEFFFAVNFNELSFIGLFVDRFVIISDVMICCLGIC